ncbi:MAG: hypothetical protein JWP00_805 [Chloroflexi bacterium]|jgi:hypothetical protein|nr:hypothetical protein [Chloroflexota bacterium]
MSDACSPGMGKGKGKWRATVVKVPDREVQSEGQAYNHQLAAVLRGCDVFRFRNFLAASGRALPDEMMLDTLKMATLMHQTILGLAELADMHDFSRQWLADNTFVPSNNQSLTEAAKRPPGVPPPAPGKRTISLRAIPLRDKADLN